MPGIDLLRPKEREKRNRSAMQTERSNGRPRGGEWADMAGCVDPNRGWRDGRLAGVVVEGEGGWHRC